MKRLFHILACIFFVLSAGCALNSKSVLKSNKDEYKNTEVNNLQDLKLLNLIFWSYSFQITWDLLFSGNKSLWNWKVVLLYEGIYSGWKFSIYSLGKYEEVNPIMHTTIDNLMKKRDFVLLNNGEYPGTGFALSFLMYQLNNKFHLSAFVVSPLYDVYMIKYVASSPEKVIDFYHKLWEIRFNK